MPSMRIYHRTKPILLVMKSLKDYIEESLLIVAFRTEKLEYYGSGIVNYSEVDYQNKLKIKNKRIEVSKPYISRERGNKIFEKFAFIKVTE